MQEKDTTKDREIFNFRHLGKPCSCSSCETKSLVELNRKLERFRLASKTRLSEDLLKQKALISNSNSSNTSSTFIDADLSFHSFEFNMAQANQEQNNVFDLSFKKANASHRASNYDDKYKQEINEDDDNDGNISVKLSLTDELSITTMNEYASESDATSKDVDLDGLHKFNFNKNDEQFQQGLKQLDQKIFKVKQILESMK
jgi:hypothetical protein